MILEFLSIATQLAAAGVICAVAIGIVDLATCGHSDWHEDRQEL